MDNEIFGSICQGIREAKQYKEGKVKAQVYEFNLKEQQRAEDADKRVRKANYCMKPVLRVVK